MQPNLLTLNFFGTGGNDVQTFSSTDLWALGSHRQGRTTPEALTGLQEQQLAHGQSTCNCSGRKYRLVGSARPRRPRDPLCTQAVPSVPGVHTLRCHLALLCNKYTASGYMYRKYDGNAPHNNHKAMHEESKCERRIEMMFHIPPKFIYGNLSP